MQKAGIIPDCFIIYNVSEAKLRKGIEDKIGDSEGQYN